jgi:hypothetical protein
MRGGGPPAAPRGHAPEPPATTDLADEHGTPAQRFYNLLCIAHGAEPRLFQDVVDKGYLPKDRADGCDEEYAQVQKAFRHLIEPCQGGARAKLAAGARDTPADPPVTRASQQKPPFAD